MPAIETRMYMPRIPKVAVVAMKAKYVNGSFQTPRASQLTRITVRTSEAMIETQGVLKRGCVHAKTFGRPPSRPMANAVRETSAVPASAATKASTTNGTSTSGADHPPTYLVASVSSAAGLLAQAAALSTPKPIDIAHVTNT